MAELDEPSARVHHRGELLLLYVHLQTSVSMCPYKRSVLLLLLLHFLLHVLISHRIDRMSTAAMARNTNSDKQMPALLAAARPHCVRIRQVQVRQSPAQYNVGITASLDDFLVGRSIGRSVSRFTCLIQLFLFLLIASFFSSPCSSSLDSPRHCYIAAACGTRILFCSLHILSSAASQSK